MTEREWGRPVCHQHGAWSRGEEDGAGNVEAAVTDDEDAAVRGPQALEPLACQEKTRRVAPPVAEEEVAARTIEHSGRVAGVERYAAVVLVGPPDDELRRRLPERADDRREITLRAIRSNQAMRSEEHTSELQSRLHLVCRLLLEKKKINQHIPK